MSRFAKISAALLSITLMLCSGCVSQLGVTKSKPPTAALSADYGGGESALAVQENARAEALFDSIYRDRLARSPIDQAFEGIYEQQDKWDNYSDAYQHESNRLDKAHLKKLQALNATLLSHANQLNLRLYQQQLEEALTEFEWRYHRYPISHMTGIHTGVATVLIRLHRVETIADANDYIKRLQAVAGLFDQVTDGLQARAAMGIVAPKFVYQQAVESSLGIITGQPFTDSDSTDSPLMADFKRKLNRMDLAELQKQQLQSAAQRALLDFVQPAYQKLIAVLRDLSEQAPLEGGAWRLPQGKAFYAHALRQTTTTDLDAEAIHRLGLSEVARIHKEMRIILEQVDYAGDLFDFFAYMQTEPTFFFPQTAEGKQAYIDEAERLISEMKGRLPEVFGVLPKADIVIKPVEPFREASAGAAFYQPASADGSRPGVFYVNTYDMSALPKYALPAIAYHEGIPGHHMQVALAQELDNVPQFRRAVSYVAYAEGWGLYAELLPKEMGLYTDFYTDFGRLSAELWRASRLVLDTALHHKGWSRERAIRYLMDNSPTDRQTAVKAVERYLVLPSQATAYKIGMLKILTLRQQAKDRLGDQFDIREFHDVVLMNGALPLNILEERVNRWINQRLQKTES